MEKIFYDYPKFLGMTEGNKYCKSVNSIEINTTKIALCLINA